MKGSSKIPDDTSNSKRVFLLFWSYRILQISTPTTAGALASFWCSHLVTQAAIWELALLGLMVGTTAGTIAAILVFMVCAYFSGTYTNSLLGVLLYEAGFALILGLMFGGIAGGVVFSLQSA